MLYLKLRNLENLAGQTYSQMMTQIMGKLK